MAGTAQFNGEVGNIESNINKVDSFDKSLSEDAARQKYPSIKCLKDFLSVIYPIGSIYISAASTSPATLFGGTWEQIKDTFLLAAGDTYTSGATGGEAEHTLTFNEMPSHSHGIYAVNTAGSDEFGVTCVGNMGVLQGNFSTSRKTTWQKMYQYEAGGGQPHNNMPPYLAVYVWQRTA